MSTQEKPTTDYPGIESLLALSPQAEQPLLDSHLMRLPGGEWTLWRTVGLRGAGFPAAGVLKLAATECAAAADQLFQFEEEARETKDAALELVNRALDALRSTADWKDDEKCAPLLKAMRRLKSGKLAAETGVDSSADAAIEASRAAAARLKPALQVFEQTYLAAASDTSRKLCETAATATFQEAIIWQNRRLYHSVIQPLLSKTPENNSRGFKQRQREELIASYLQRYCVKNDTIGFFGPVGWARFVENEEWVAQRPGANFLQARQVYFEGWGIDLLAETLGKNRALRAWAVPRVLPFVHLDGELLRMPFQKPTRLTTRHAAVLRACDGERTAQEVAAHLLKNLALGLRGQAEVFNILEAFKIKGLIAWTIEVSLVLNPDRRLRRMMEKIDDEQIRRPVFAILDELEAGRLKVERAAGDAESLDRALDNLDQTFTKLTGSASTRAGGEGKAYAARTLVYEDCRRDIEVELGTEFTKALGAPLSLLLTSARWLTHEAAASFRRVFKQVYNALVSKSGSPTIELIDFWYGIVPLLFEGGRNPIDAILPEFQKRWADVLALPEDGERRVQYDCEELRARVLAAFDAPAPGWVAARYHSPDVMIAATDVQAIRRGDYQFVMGEMHVGVNTMRGAMFPAQHPQPEEFEKFFDLDFPETRVVPVGPKSWPELTARTLPTLLNPRDHLFMVTPDSFGAPPAQALNIGALVIEQTREGLIVKTRDGLVSFEVVEFFADILSTMVVDYLKILQPRQHTPRVTFDRLVICRETWRFTPEEAGFAFAKTEAERFLAARRWMRDKGLPRFIFIKAPVEPKPFYMDFDSPVYVEMFARAVRRTQEKGAEGATITASEMLPGPQQNWLRDAEGNAYTSELRLVAVDPAGRASRA